MSKAVRPAVEVCDVSIRYKRGDVKQIGLKEYLMRKLTNLSSTDLGEVLNKDHATILYSVKQVEQKLAKGDTEMQNHIRDITANINSCL